LAPKSGRGRAFVLDFFGTLDRMATRGKKNLKAQSVVLHSKAKTVEDFKALLPFSSLPGEANL
jgi:hypothetical protein